VRSAAAVCDYGDGTLIDCYAESKICVAGGCVVENTAPPQAGDLVITELLYDPVAVPDEQGEYIEIFNLSTTTVDLNGVVVSNQSTSNLVLSSQEPLELESGTYFLIGASEDIGTSGSVSVDFVATDFSMSNGGDHIALSYDGEIIDELTYDNGGGFPSAQGAALNLDPSHLNATDNDHGTNWCLAIASFGTGDLGTPRAPNTTCVNPCNPNPCTEPPEPVCDGDILLQPERQEGLCQVSGGQATCEYGETSTDCTISGQICQGGACTGGGAPPQPGDLVVTEIMKDPYILPDTDGEWFEILNTSGQDLDLVGLVVADDQANSFTVTAATPLIISPGQYFVFGPNDDPVTNGGVMVDYTYSYLALNNGEDGLTLTHGGQLIDEVHYDDGVFFPDPNGASINLDPAHLDSAENDTGAHWCEAVTLYHPNNAGTPGAENDNCGSIDPCSPNPCTNPPEPTCTGTERTYPTLSPGTCSVNGTLAECDYGLEVEDCADSGLDCENGQCVSTDPTPEPGDLLITEIMRDPETLSDYDAEWFEILNISGHSLDLQGMTVRDAGSNTFTLPTGSPLLVADGQYFVMGRNGDQGTNGGVTIDYVYGSQMMLGNGEDEIILEHTSQLIDAVYFDDTQFPHTAGASMTLDASHFNTADNDTGANWCNGTTVYTTDNHGTPGAENDPC
jgi:hypothetical protein